MANTPRPWSTDEDALLKQAVAQYGDEPGIWKTIAELIPGRSNKACRKRWLHSLSPTIRKTPWTPAEDALLLKLYATHHPPRWSLIAKHIPGRTDDACAKRYREALDPELKRDGWSPEEDTALLQLTESLGTKWSQVGRAMGRSGLGCRNRWRLLQRKQRLRITPPRHDVETSLPPGDHPLLSPFGSAHSPSLILSPPPCAISTLSSLSGALASPRGTSLTTCTNPLLPVQSPSPTHTPPARDSPDQSRAHTQSPPLLVRDQDPPPVIVHPSPPPDSLPPPAPPRKRPRLCGPSSSAPEHPRLSSHLPADLHRTVLPYACGHPTCWPASTGNGASLFATASELAEHRRLTHPGPSDGTKIYRCALQGCEKGWKNINGIQYHLQISKAHFQNALTRVPSDTTIPASNARPAVTPTVDIRATGKRKEFHCPYAGCTNSYKQRTGLQYHLAHGHPTNVQQLDVIPPVLMQKFKEGV